MLSISKTNKKDEDEKQISLHVLPLISEGFLMFLKGSPSVLIFGYKKWKGNLLGFSFVCLHFFKTLLTSFFSTTEVFHS